MEEKSKSNKLLQKTLMTFFVFLFFAPVHASDPSLVAEWHFDEGSGSVLGDSSGNGNDGTIYGSTWTEGIKGTSLSFDGVDDFVKIPYTSMLDITNEITIESWIKLKTNTSYGFILSKRSSEYGIMPYELIYHKRLNCFQFQFKDIPEHSWNWACDKESPSTDKWYYLVGVFNGTNTIIYVNNKKTIGTNTHSLPTNNAYVAIGKDGASNNPEYYFHGLIDEVRIYNRALSDAEIKAHYESIILPPYPEVTENALLLVAGSDWRDWIAAQSTGRRVIFADKITDRIKKEIANSAADQIWLLGDIENANELGAVKIQSRDDIPKIFFNTTQGIYTDKQHAILAALIAAKEQKPIYFEQTTTTEDLTEYTNEELQERYLEGAEKNIDNIIVANTNSILGFSAPSIAKDNAGIPVVVEVSFNYEDAQAANNSAEIIKQSIRSTAGRLGAHGLYSKNKEYRKDPIYLTLLGNENEIPFFMLPDDASEIIFDMDGDYIYSDVPYTDLNDDGYADVAYGRIITKTQLSLEKIETARILGEYKHSKYTMWANLGGGLWQAYLANNALKSLAPDVERMQAVEVREGLLDAESLEKVKIYFGLMQKFRGAQLGLLMLSINAAENIISLVLETDWDNWDWLSLEYPPKIATINESHFAGLEDTQMLLFFGVGNENEVLIPKENRTEEELILDPYGGSEKVTSIKYDDFFYADWDMSGRLNDGSLIKETVEDGAFGFASTGQIHDPYTWETSASVINRLALGESLGESLQNTINRNTYTLISNIVNPLRILLSVRKGLNMKNTYERVLLGNPKHRLFEKTIEYEESWIVSVLEEFHKPPKIKQQASAMFAGEIMQTPSTALAVEREITNNYTVEGDSITTTSADNYIIAAGAPTIPVKLIDVPIPSGGVLEDVIFSGKYKNATIETVQYMMLDEHYNETEILAEFPGASFWYSVEARLDGTSVVHAVVPLVLYDGTTASILEKAGLQVIYYAPLEITEVLVKNTTIGNNSTATIKFESQISENGTLYLYLDNEETEYKDITIGSGKNTYEFTIISQEQGRHAVSVVYDGQTAISAKHATFYVFDPVFELFPPASLGKERNHESTLPFKFTVHDSATGTFIADEFCTVYVGETTYYCGKIKDEKYHVNVKLDDLMPGANTITVIVIGAESAFDFVLF